MIKRDLSTVPLRSVRRNTKGGCAGRGSDGTENQLAPLRLRWNLLSAWWWTQAEYKHAYFGVTLLGPAEV